MAQAELLALVAASYAVTLFAIHRVGMARRRARGPDLRRLRRFDARVLLADLEPVYRAGLPDEPPAPVAWPQRVEAPPPIAATSPWESPALLTLRSQRDALFAGEPVNAVPGAAFASLVVHAWGRALARGEPEQAIAIAEAVDESSPALAAKLAAYAQIERCDRAVARGSGREAYRAAAQAVRALERAGARHSDADLSSRYLCVYLKLMHLTNAWNLELGAFAAVRRLRRAIRDAGHAPCLYLLLAYARAVSGRSEDAVDELGRAIYYARGDAFYAAPALEDEFVAKLRPALVAQCRALAEPLTPDSARR